jgi:hypothetical protein
VSQLDLSLDRVLGERAASETGESSDAGTST